MSTSTQTPTRLTINVSPSFRDELKIQAIANGKTLKDYVIETLTDRIQQDSVGQDRLWAQMSEEAKAEGCLTGEESEDLLTRMANA